jgi:TatD DNase family protein
MIDTHCHVHGAEFDTDRAAVLARAVAAGVERVLTMGEGLEDNGRALCVTGEHDLLRPCLGLHPDHADEPLEPVVEQIRAHADELTAIGEVGLDFWIAKEPGARERQRLVLRRMVALALEVDLPLSVHSRSAGHHAVSLLEDLGARRVCLHAFDGSAKHAGRAAGLGFLLSVPPSVVRSEQKQKLVRRVPLESLMLETDSPVLGPDRERRNEPANVAVAARAIAEIKGLPLDEVLAVTTANARRLFRL